MKRPEPENSSPVIILPQTLFKDFGVQWPEQSPIFQPPIRCARLSPYLVRAPVYSLSCMSSRAWTAPRNPCRSTR